MRNCRYVLRPQNYRLAISFAAEPNQLRCLRSMHLWHGSLHRTTCDMSLQPMRHLAYIHTATLHKSHHWLGYWQSQDRMTYIMLSRLHPMFESHQLQAALRLGCPHPFQQHQSPKGEPSLKGMFLWIWKVLIEVFANYKVRRSRNVFWPRCWGYLFCCCSQKNASQSLSGKRDRILHCLKLAIDGVTRDWMCLQIAVSKFRENFKVTSLAEKIV